MRLGRTMVAGARTRPSRPVGRQTNFVGSDDSGIRFKFGRSCVRLPWSSINRQNRVTVIGTAAVVDVSVL